MKLLITGGTGFVGKSLLRFLVDQQQKTSSYDEVFVLSRNSGEFLTKNPEFSHLNWLKFVKGNILDLETLPSQLQFSDVIHAASDSVDIPGATLLDKYDQIVKGTRNVLEYSAKSKVKRFLYTSSGAVYGPQPLNLTKIDENFIGSPNVLDVNNLYGLAKKQAELLCTVYSEMYGLEIKIARCFAFVGPDLPLSAHFAIGNFIKNALEKNTITVSGDGTPLRTYLYQEDMARWLLKILKNGVTKQAYNVGSDEVISIGDLAHLIRDTLSPESEIIIKNKSSNINRNIYVPNVDKVKNELNLKINFSLLDSLKNTFHSLKNKS
jgi:dTDP-glucose 4,6-dehydratase